MSGTNDDNDDLRGHDLSAWEVPPPPPASVLADAVLARMEAADDVTDVAVVGLPVDPRDVPPPTRTRRGLVIAGVAAACLAGGVGIYALVSSARPAGAPSGAVVADRARTLSLDGVSADLDPGADVRWLRDGDVLRVEQRAGAVAWRIADDARVVIASSDAGATVASVEASGASLRVEVTMNPTDVRVLGASALTAAAVSLVTVTVYSGHVKLSGAHHPVVVVQAGETRTVRPAPSPEPPVVGASTPADPEDHAGLAPFDPTRSTIADVRVRAGETATIRSPLVPAMVEIDGGESGCSLVVDDERLAGPIATLDQGVYDYELTCGGRTYHGSLTVELARGIALPEQPPRETIEADGGVYRVAYRLWMPDIEVTGGSGELHVARGASQRTYATPLIPGTDLANGTYKVWFSRDRVSTLTIDHESSGPSAYVAMPARWDDEVDVAGLAAPGTSVSIAGVQVPVDAARRFVARTAVSNGAVFVRAEHAQSGIEYHLLRAPTASPKPVTVAAGGCDAVALLQTGKQRAARGQHAAALASFEASLKCAASYEATSLAFVAACSSRNAPRAAHHHKRLLPKDRPRLEPVCDRLGVSYDGMDAQACLDVHKKVGKDLLGQGAFDAALAQFERALSCAEDLEARQLALTAACKLKDAAKAKAVYERVRRVDDQTLEVCVQNGIDLHAPAPACDAEELKERGMQKINMGEHAEALADFEESLRCKDDPYVRQLAFMEACASSNSPKAKHYYKLLTKAQQDKFDQICIRQKPPVAYKDDEGPAPDADTKGKLDITVTPGAVILIDGRRATEVAAGEHVVLRLRPGKYKVTFVIDDDRFTYPVVIEAGKTATMSKDLR